MVVRLKQKKDNDLSETRMCVWYIYWFVVLMQFVDEMDANCKQIFSLRLVLAF